MISRHYWFIFAAESAVFGRKNVNHSKFNNFVLRAHNIDYLRYTLGTHDWSECLASTDIHYVYDTFLKWCSQVDWPAYT